MNSVMDSQNGRVMMMINWTMDSNPEISLCNQWEDMIVVICIMIEFAFGVLGVLSYLCWYECE
jgi:hypothetical protein